MKNKFFLSIVLAFSVICSFSVIQANAAPFYNTKTFTSFVEQNPNYCYGAKTLTKSGQWGCKKPAELIGKVYPDYKHENLSAEQERVSSCSYIFTEKCKNITGLPTPSDAKKRVAILGNSHAAQYRSSIITWAKSKNFLVDDYTLGVCLLTYNKRDKNRKSHCKNRKIILDQRISAIVWGKYDYVIAAVNYTNKKYARNYYKHDKTILNKIRNSGAQTVVIRDNPYTKSNYLSCIKKYGYSKKCKLKRSKSFKIDKLYDAAIKLKIRTLNFNDIYCKKRKKDHLCPLVIGSVAIHADSSHLTSLNAMGLTKIFANRLNWVLGI
jgi:hypothetical protein